MCRSALPLHSIISLTNPGDGTYYIGVFLYGTAAKVIISEIVIRTQVAPRLTLLGDMEPFTADGASALDLQPGLPDERRQSAGQCRVLVMSACSVQLTILPAVLVLADRVKLALPITSCRCRSDRLASPSKSRAKSLAGEYGRVVRSLMLAALGSHCIFARRLVR